MAVAPQILPDPNAAVRPRSRRPRSPSVAKPAYFIIQILDESGQPVQFDKKRVKLVSVERNSDKVLELVEAGTHPHAFYLRGIVPVARQAQPRANSPAQQTAA